MSRGYRVEWSIDIDADSPREAAEQALAIMRNPNSRAVVFDLYEHDGDGEAIQIDLAEGE